MSGVWITLSFHAIILVYETNPKNLGNFAVSRVIFCTSIPHFKRYNFNRL